MKKRAKKTIDYSKVIGIGLGTIGLVIVILLVVILAKELRDDDKYKISYRSDDKLAEQVIEKDNNTITNPEASTEETAKINEADKYISVQKALEIALENVGAEQQAVRDIDVELEYKFGQAVYEVTFDFNQFEYEYYLNAESGEIIKSFKEIEH